MTERSTQNTSKTGPPRGALGGWEGVRVSERAGGALGLAVLTIAALALGVILGRFVLMDKSKYFFEEMQAGRIVLVEGGRWRTNSCMLIKQRFESDLLSEPSGAVEAVTPQGVHRGWARLEPKSCGT